MNHNPSNHPSAQSLRDILSRYITDSKGNTQLHGSHEPEPSAGQQNSRYLKFLKPIPWILVLVFLFSFYWDFDSVEATLFSHIYSVEGLLRIISISGLIGFLTNRIAITMLFRPIKKRPLLGHGLIPAQKDRIARRLAISVADDMINPELIQKKIEESGAIRRYRTQVSTSISELLETPEFKADIKSWMASSLRDVVEDSDFRTKLARDIATEIERSSTKNSIDRAALKAYTFLKGERIQDITDSIILQLPEKINKQETLIDHYLDTLPGMIDRSGASIDQFITVLLERLVQQLDVKKIVEENLRSYDEEKLEKMIKGATNEQLHTIQYLGAVLGTVGGFVIWQPTLSIAVIGTISVLIYAADRLLGGTAKVLKMNDRSSTG